MLMDSEFHALVLIEANILLCLDDFVKLGV